ncbi:hypothetical protein L2E82_09070 [Cichorium intybus]|uniref:Uncharacterized protein n=1 Tax=Cichorium intybus TaxID=13427 RepID=A0ACB9G7G6_CICIN|nr:hypothetical protein L2E82_09070 [Cichorium intybus]
MTRGNSSLTRAPAANERQRRDRMKQLYSNLASLLHLQPYERMPLPEFLDRAANSLMRWKERVERLKARKEQLENELRCHSNNGESLQLVRVTEMGSKLEVNLIIMANNKKAEPFHVLSIIEQGGAEITSSSFCTVDQRIYCTIHAQAFQARVGFDVALIESQLLELVYFPCMR